MKTGLLPFILAMIATPAAKLATANPDKLAARYEISPEAARFYLECWISR